jgi:molecular chaperone GrpE
MKSSPNDPIAPEENHQEPAATPGTEHTSPDNNANASEAPSDLTIQIQELKDQNLRLYAEFENFRKRTARERLDLITSANESTLKSLLTVLDDFERALKLIPAEDAVSEGMRLIHAKLTDTLKSQGLKPMDPTTGTTFDPEFMEAITTLTVADPQQSGLVLEEVERGYRVGEKIIRYAKVVVGKTAEA